VFFQVPEICHNLQAKTKQELMREVKRDTPLDKIEGKISYVKNH
jgi:hypothetical protein